MGPRTLRIFQTYWTWSLMVEKSGGYFGPPFQVYGGLTQGYLLSHTVFNVVVYTMIRNWVTVVAPTEAGADGLGETIQELEVFSCADCRLVASPQLERLHRVFDILTDLFGWLGLRTNIRKMLIIAFRPCFIPVVFTKSAYMQLVTGIVPS